MLRIIAGIYKNRKLELPPSNITRPTMDRVREAVFSSIDSDITNSVFLDLFSGSGIIGLEAISRGALKVYLNDASNKAIEVIEKNVNSLNCAKNVVISKKDYSTCLNDLSSDHIKFDIVYIDPPYEMKLIKKILDKLVELNLLNDNALVIFESLEEGFVDERFNLKVYKYGNKYVSKYTLKEKYE